MSLRENPTPRCFGARWFSAQRISRRFPARVASSLVLCVAVFPAVWVFAQNSAQKNPEPSKYDIQAETKGKGIVDEIKMLEFGPRKDFVELIVKDGDNKIVMYICPKPFQDEMGIAFTKGDEITFTGAKLKQDAGDVILTRQLVKGTDTLMFRDDKGNPVWNWHTGK